jgi:hypothetical protein
MDRNSKESNFSTLMASSMFSLSIWCDDIEPFCCLLVETQLDSNTVGVSQASCVSGELPRPDFASSSLMSVSITTCILLGGLAWLASLSKSCPQNARNEFEADALPYLGFHALSMYCPLTVICCCGRFASLAC